MTQLSEDLFFERLSKKNDSYSYKLPSRQEAGKFMQKLIDFLFPVTYDCKQIDQKIDLQESFLELKNQFECILTPLEGALEKSRSETTNCVFENIPKIYELLLLDAKSISENDPAAVSIEEVIAIYPGFTAIAIYRFANCLSLCGIPLLPRMLTEFGHSLTGIDIHPNATIGHSFCIDHGTGVVIGETAHIGNNVKLYQGVTLGATHVSKSMASKKRHPTIEDNVVVYANATILGGETVIGQNSIIGGNAWILKSVPAYSQVYYEGKLNVKSPSLPTT